MSQLVSHEPYHEDYAELKDGCETIELVVYDQDKESPREVREPKLASSSSHDRPPPPGRILAFWFIWRTSASSESLPAWPLTYAGIFVPQENCLGLGELGELPGSQ